MLLNKENFKVTSREMEVLKILWNASAPMTASDIVKENPELTMNTVQAVLRKLLKNNFIEVADIVYSGTVLTRSYKSAISAEDFAAKKVVIEANDIVGKLHISSLVATFLDMEEDGEDKANQIKELEQIIKEYKDKEC